MGSPRLLDLFCCAGGASKGYADAGFEVVGVDVNPQPRYPYEFVKADAMTYPLDGFDAVHASPPCKRFTRLAALHAARRHPDLLTPTRERLLRSGLPWVIENVPGSPMRADLVLCGEMFGLGVRRHRWFETSPSLFSMLPPCRHDRRVVSVHGMPGGRSTRDGVLPTFADWKAAMAIDWMSVRELSQAIPPAYTRYIGHQLLAHLAVARG